MFYTFFILLTNNPGDINVQIPKIIIELIIIAVMVSVLKNRKLKILRDFKFSIIENAFIGCILKNFVMVFGNTFNLTTIIGINVIRIPRSNVR